MSSKLKKGSLEVILLVFLGLTAVFSVAAFAAKENPVERPITTVVCKLRPTDIACQTPATSQPREFGSAQPTPTPTPTP